MGLIFEKTRPTRILDSHRHLKFVTQAGEVCNNAIALKAPMRTTRNLRPLPHDVHLNQTPIRESRGNGYHLETQQADRARQTIDRLPASSDYYAQGAPTTTFSTICTGAPTRVVQSQRRTPPPLPA